MRFSCTKVCATSRPRPSSPSMVEAGTRTPVSETSAWSDGMLKVHHIASTLKPGVVTGTRKAEMLANDRHGEVGTLLAAQLFRQSEAQMAGLVGAAAHLG